MNDAMISVQGLAKTYGFSTRKVEAVRGIGFEVGRGEIFGLVGPDGAGKTTTMQILCGILTPTRGQATVAGVDVIKNPGGLGGRIGYMSEALPFMDLSVCAKTLTSLLISTKLHPKNVTNELEIFYVLLILTMPPNAAPNIYPVA